MSVLMGAARIDENGKVSGGAAGDQTGKEVCTQAFYSKPWDYMAIHPDASVREKHAACCEAACANDNIGYDQGQRNTLHALAKAANFDYSKITTKCECDCSSLQNSLAVASGSGATYGSNGWTTYTMKAALEALGYKIITDSTYLANSAYCVRGAIYVKASSHTVCGLTNGSSYKKTLEKAGISTGSSSTSASSGTTTAAASTASASSKEVKATEPAHSGPSSSLKGTYKVTADDGLNVRNGAGTAKNSYGSDKSVLVAIPKGTKVQCYGYYTTVSGTKWLYIQFTYNGTTYIGFASSAYLEKV